MSNKISKIISFVRAIRNGAKLSDTKNNPGGGALITSEHFADPGDDSHPLPIDYCAIMGIIRSGGSDGVAVGYADIINEKLSQPGEKRIYARDESGAEVGHIWLKNTGEIEITNGSGSFVMAPGGTVTINSVVIGTDGSITTPGDITANEVQTDGGIILGNHTHGGVQTGGGSTGGPQ